MGDPVVNVRYFAAARSAAGVTEEQVAASDLAELVDLLGRYRGEALTRVLQRCSYLVDGLVARDRSTTLPAGSTVDILPPFAGG